MVDANPPGGLEGPDLRDLVMFRCLIIWLAQTVAMAGFGPGTALAEEPEFYFKPYAPDHWTFGRRLDESELRYCVDTRDPDWQVGATIADAIAAALLLEPQRHVIERDFVAEDITKVYGLLIEHCDLQLGFKLIPGAYRQWATLTRAYYESGYVFVTDDPEINALGDLPPGRPIGATLGTSAHVRLVSYISALPQDDRWPAYPMGTNDLALDALLGGTVDVALVWAPTLWAKQQADAAYAGLRVISADPLPPTTVGVGAIMLGEETFLRTTIDEAIEALIEDGTIDRILAHYQFPATAVP